MDKKPGFFQYKCRRCGDVFAGAHSGGDLDLTLIELMTDGHSIYKPGAIIPMQTFHDCKTDIIGIGIADCIGVEFTGRNPE